MVYLGLPINSMVIFHGYFQPEDVPQERIGPGCSCIDPSTAEAVASATPGAATVH